MALLLPEDGYDSYLTASIGSSDATVYVNTLPTKTAGVLTIFALDGRTVVEKIYYTGIASSPNRLTTVTRGLATIDTAGVLSFAAVTANQVSHPANARIAMTDNVHYLGRALSVLNGDEAFGGVPQMPSSRTIDTSRDLVDKEYADLVGATAGGITAFAVTQNGVASLLQVNVGAGTMIGAASIVTYAGAAAQAVTNSATNYVQLTIAGALVINTTGFTDGNLPLATVVASGGSITSVTDKRAWLTMALTPNQSAALAGTAGTPSASNLFVTDQDTSSVIDQSQTTVNGTTAVGEANITTKRFRVSQTFVPGRTDISAVSLWKKADTGTFTGTVTVVIDTDAAGNPAFDALATVTLSNATYLALSNDAEFTATFSSPYLALTVGATYHIRVEISTNDTSNHPNLGIKTTSGYASGVLKWQNTTDGWTSTTTDLYFKTIYTSAGKIPRLDTNGALPAVSGASLTALPAPTTLAGVSANVTAANLTTLTGAGDAGALHYHKFAAALQTTISASGTTTITVGFAPKLVRISAFGGAASGTAGTTYSSHGSSDGSNSKCIGYMADGGGTPYIAFSSTTEAYRIRTNGSGTQHGGVINNFTATSFDIVNTKAGSPPDSYLQYEVWG